ncbi:MAG: rod shape-determining protein MreC [Rhizobiales bacterium]|nr:rod shape-determining protein MreC [Hyphomicrobiales bacterium]
MFSLSSEVDRLRDENRILRDWRQKALELKDRAERYEALLQMQPDAGNSMIAARAIADVHTPFTRSLIINAGEFDGVSQGNAVLGTKGLVGRVISAGSNSSRVLLINDLESRIPVHVGPGRYRSILAGTNGREPTLMHLPAGAELSNGDIVLTSGEARLLPPGLTIGEVRLGENGSVSVLLGSDPDSVEFVRIYNSEFPIDVAEGAPPLPELLADGGPIADPVPIAAVIPLDSTEPGH